MNIFIPTLGRIEQQKTWDRIPEKLRPNTFLVCPPSEYEEHRKRGRNAMPCCEKGIANVRQWLVGNEKGKFVMTDDDQYFFRRAKIDEPKLRVCTSKDMEEMFERIEVLLDRYPMVGISARQGNDAFLGLRRGATGGYEIEPGLAINKRVCNMYGVRPDVLKKYGIRFDDVKLMEDMHASLSLIAKGHDVGLITEFVWNQCGSGRKGGCSNYRNAELQKEAAIRLAKLHHPYVAVIKKRSIDAGAWQTSVGEYRIDVRVDWTAAVEGARLSKKRLI